MTTSTQKQHIVALSNKHHKTLTFASVEDYSFAADRNTVPLLPFEIPQAAQSFAIIFPDKRNSTPHALLGLGNKNIFVDEEGHWKGSYLPLILANYPFSIIEAHFTEETDAEKKTELAIGIDENAPHFHQSNGQPLFDEEGKPTQILTRIKDVLISQYRRQAAMSQALAELTLHGALEERTITVQYSGMKKNVGGLRCANREKILELPETTLGHWVKTGLMEMLYAHWQSFYHLPVLLKDPSCPTSEKKENVQ